MESSKQGRILRGVGGLYEVLCGEEIIRCRARGAFRHQATSPEVGDWVELRVDEKGNSIIDSIAPRKNLLIRPPMANLDLLLAVLPTASPAPDLRTLDKLTAISVHLQIETAIIISKSDLDPQKSDELAHIYQSIFPVFQIDILQTRGVLQLSDFLQNKLPGKIAAFAGASGVGKSTLLNRLFPDLSLATGAVSEKTERGRHTTRKVELFPHAGGFIADTPGFTMLDFEHFDFFTKEDLTYTFPEFEPYLGKCRYTKCSHTKEDGCAILEAKKRGEISQSRHDSYLELYTTLKNKREWK
jgi:ribosome biogenesis GTPase